MAWDELKKDENAMSFMVKAFNSNMRSWVESYREKADNIVNSIGPVEFKSKEYIDGFNDGINMIINIMKSDLKEK
jgi:hypothetical protein